MGLVVGVGVVLALLVGGGTLVLLTENAGDGAPAVLLDARFEQSTAPFPVGSSVGGHEYTFERVDGTYRISAGRDDPPVAAHAYGEFVHVTRNVDLTATVVGVDAEPGRPVALGMSCARTDTSGAVEDGYMVVFRGDDVAIARVNEPASALAAGKAPRTLGANTLIGFSCQRRSIFGDEVEVTASIDGTTVLTAREDPGYRMQLTGMTLDVFGSRAGDAVRFDDVTARNPRG
ncbi:MAG: hypothetical protein R2726_16905 [Acidimicrobiales bacterium]